MGKKGYHGRSEEFCNRSKGGEKNNSYGDETCVKRGQKRRKRRKFSKMKQQRLPTCQSFQCTHFDWTNRDSPGFTGRELSAQRE